MAWLPSRLSRNWNEELRPITRRPSIRDSAMMKPSERPSEKYCWASSPLSLASGSTAIERSPGTAAARTGATGAGRSTKRSVSRRTTAIASTPMIARSARRLAVRRSAAGAWAASLSGLIPCAVNSKRQENTSQNGKPMAAAARNHRVTPSGAPTTGASEAMPWASAHTEPM